MTGESVRDRYSAWISELLQVHSKFESSGCSAEIPSPIWNEDSALDEGGAYNDPDMITDTQYTTSDMLDGARKDFLDVKHPGLLYLWYMLEVCDLLYVAGIPLPESSSPVEDGIPAAAKKRRGREEPDADDNSSMESSGSSAS